MKKKTIFCYFIICFILFIMSCFLNQGYFNRLSNQNNFIYQLKQVACILVLYVTGYLFLKALQSFFDEIWVQLLAMPCGVALWVFVGQFLFIANITYFMHRVFIVLTLLIAISFGIRRFWGQSLKLSIMPPFFTILIVVGTAFLVSTGLNYINMNYDSYLYFANYGKMMAFAGDYREWNTENAYVITNIGQFLPILNSYTAFWGLEYCLPIQSFMVLNMSAIFGKAIYEACEERGLEEKKRAGYTILFIFVLVSCTCVVVYANWMLSNAFIMYYLTIAGIIGGKKTDRFCIDHAMVLSGCGLAITLLRKDGIIIVCFLFVCYCCNKIAKPYIIGLLLSPSVVGILSYIMYVRLFLKSQTRIAVGTSILSNKFVVMLCCVILLTILYIFLFHRFLERWCAIQSEKRILIALLLSVIAAIVLKPGVSIDHIDAILHVLVSPAYGYVLLLWLLILAIMLTGKIRLNYETLLVCGYCMLTFLIYWNKGNTERGIDNSGMRAFVQIVPMMIFWSSKYIIDVFSRKVQIENSDHNMKVQ